MKKLANYIFSYQYQGKYHAERIIDNLDESLWRLEYGDVANKEYQIWEYPEGKIYDIVSDREIEKDDFSTPDNNRWLPELKYLKTDKVLVTQEYNRLLNVPPRQSLFKRISNLFKR